MKELKSKLKKRGGFTLVEMLLVVAIVTIMAAISIPVVNMNLEKARDAADLANERAAKTLATMVYMGEIDPLDYGFPYEGYEPGTAINTWHDETGMNARGMFYDAQNGCITFEKPLGKGYGKCTGCGKIDNPGQPHKDCIILMSIDGKGTVSISWVSDQDEESPDWGV